MVGQRVVVVRRKAVGIERCSLSLVRGSFQPFTIEARAGTVVLRVEEYVPS